MYNRKYFLSDNIPHLVTAPPLILPSSLCCRFRPASRAPALPYTQESAHADIVDIVIIDIVANVDIYTPISRGKM